MTCLWAGSLLGVAAAHEEPLARHDVERDVEVAAADPEPALARHEGRARDDQDLLVGAAHQPRSSRRALAAASRARRASTSGPAGPSSIASHSSMRSR